MEIRKKRQTKKDQRTVTPIYFMGGALGVILLVASAFFGPEIVFAIQDDIRCSVVVAVNPEELDITSFNTGYETDLYKRLNRFAEGLAAEEQYYVTVQDMEVTEELADWLTEWRYQNDMWNLIWDLRVLPEELYDYHVLRWQRCVIYGNDFAGGVNFILWYLELGIDDEPLVKLLLDGETGGIYGIRTDFKTFQRTSTELESAKIYMDQSMSIEALTLWELCFMLAEKYGGINLDEFWKWVSSADNVNYYLIMQTDGENDIGYWDWEAVSDKYSVEDSQTDDAYNTGELTRLLRGLSWQVSTLKSDGELHWSFFFPYGESRLEFRMYSGGVFWTSSKSDSYSWFTDMTFGFPDIYERIPAFMEELQ